MTGAIAHGVSRASLVKSKAKRQEHVPKRGFQPTTGEAKLIDEISFDNRHSIVNIEPLKVFASQNLPREHPLRRLLAAERSQLTPQEYLAKLDYNCLSMLARSSHEWKSLRAKKIDLSKFIQVSLYYKN